MGKITVRRFLTSGVILAAFAFSAAAQDWYQQREISEEQWRLHLFAHVRDDFAKHVWTGVVKDKELERLTKTEDELTKMQADLDQTRWDNGVLNDVIDSIAGSHPTTTVSRRVTERCWQTTLRRLKEFRQDQHNHPPRAKSRVRWISTPEKTDKLTGAR